MILRQKLQYLYPELEDKDFHPVANLIILQDDSDGRGPYIKVWNYNKPQPTQEQLNAID